MYERRTVLILTNLLETSVREALAKGRTLLPPQNVLVPRVTFQGRGQGREKGDEEQTGGEEELQGQRAGSNHGESERVREVDDLKDTSCLEYFDACDQRPSTGREAPSGGRVVKGKEDK